MLKLMKQCNKIEEIHEAEKKKSTNERLEKVVNEPARRQKIQETTTQVNPLTLLNGVVPGTKWCGLGDLAHDFHDLGPDKVKSYREWYDNVY